MGPADHSWLSPETRRHTEAVVDAVVREFAGVISPETVERLVDESLDHWSAARVQDYIPVLLHRFVRQRLRALAQVRGAIAKDVPEVLFVCVHNAGRSQMAAALLDHYAAGAVHVRSAGSAPGERVDPAVVTALLERGIDVGKEFPKPLTDEVVDAADVVVTMGCGDACPVYPGKGYHDWALPDPTGRSIEEVREIRDDIERRVRELLAELTHAHA